MKTSTTRNMICIVTVVFV